MGQGLYDSTIKRAKFETAGYERVVTAQWDRKLKCLQCIVPPLTWLFGGQEVSAEELEKIKQQPIRVNLTFNNQEWISALEFKYHDHKVDRVAYAHTFGVDIADLGERDKAWRAEEAEGYAADMPAEEVKKREEEKAKKALEETEESNTVPKRKGVKIFVYGQHFVKTEVIFGLLTIIGKSFNICFILFVDIESEIHPCSDRCIEGIVRHLQKLKETRYGDP